MQESKPYSVQRFRGGYAITFHHEGARRRLSLVAAGNRAEAEIEAARLWSEIIAPPEVSTVGDIWSLYIREYEGRAVVATMKYTWRALQARFENLKASAITPDICRAHIAERRAAGIGDGTIHTELGHLRMVLLWYAREVDGKFTAPRIVRPGKPQSNRRFMTRADIARLIETAEEPHVRLFVILAVGTGARASALLGLTWDRCDFERRLIDLNDPQIKRPHKGRAVVAMNDMVHEALLEAQKRREGTHVIAWAGEPVASIRKALARAGEKAGVGHVHPHLLRHSAAVHMAEAGVPMPAIARFLGHRNDRMTQEVYARFSPSYMRDAVGALDYRREVEVHVNQGTLHNTPLSPWEHGGRGWDRTSDPYDVNVVLSR